MSGGVLQNASPPLKRGTAFDGCIRALVLVGSASPPLLKSSPIVALMKGAMFCPPLNDDLKLILASSAPRSLSVFQSVCRGWPGEHIVSTGRAANAHSLCKLSIRFVTTERGGCRSRPSSAWSTACNSKAAGSTIGRLDYEGWHLLPVCERQDPVHIFHEAAH